MNLSSIPEHMRHGVEGYITCGWKPGSFLYAVLCNNLVEAAANADDVNKHALFEWASLLYNELPAGSWGSPEIVANWIMSKTPGED